MGKHLKEVDWIRCCWLFRKLLHCYTERTHGCYLSYLVWSACCQTSDGGGRLLFVLPAEKVLQILAGLRHRTTDHVMGERENNRGIQRMVGFDSSRGFNSLSKVSSCLRSLSVCRVMIGLENSGNLLQPITRTKPRLFVGWITISTGEIATRWISFNKTNHSLHCIVIYHVDSVIHLPNNLMLGPVKSKNV